MAEEKQLTVEEMKSLISVLPLLQSLLDKIDNINKDVADLRKSFKGIMEKFNDNTTAVIEYKESIDTLIKKQPKFNLEDLEKNLNGIKEILKKANAQPEEEKKAAPKKTTAKTTKKEETKPTKDEDHDKVIEIVDKILADRRGNKKRVLTVIDIKKGFKADDILAAKVIQWFEKNGMYNPKLKELTFPKN